MKLFIVIFVAVVILGAVGLSPANALNALGPGLYDDRMDANGLLAYAGTNGWLEQVWTTAPTNCAINGTTTRYPATTGTNGTIDFSIWGAGFVVMAFESPSGPDVNICVDGTCSMVSFAAAGTACKQVEVTGLDYDVHDIELQYADNAGIFYFDAVLVLPPAPQPTLPPQEIIVEVTVDISAEITPEPYMDYFDLTDSEENTQTVAFQYTATAGDVFLGLVVVAILFILLTAFIFWLWRTKDTPDE